MSPLDDGVGSVKTMWVYSFGDGTADDDSWVPRQLSILNHDFLIRLEDQVFELIAGQAVHGHDQLVRVVNFKIKNLRAGEVLVPTTNVLSSEVM